MIEAIGPEEAMGRVTKDRSYDKVYASLVLTPYGKEIWEGFTSRYRDLSVRDYRFEVHGPSRFTMYVDLGKAFQGRDGWMQEDNITEDSWRFKPDNITDMNLDGLSHLAWDQLSGKKVPSYNVDVYQTVGYSYCKQYGHPVLSSKRDKLDRSRQSTFKDWFLNKFYALQSEFISGRVRSLQGQIHTIKQSQDYKDRLQTAVMDQCMKDVGEVLAKYSELGDEALKRAIQSYVVDDIIGA